MQELTAKLFEEAVLPAVAAGGSFQLTVTGSSMAPTLKNGVDAVLLEKAEHIQPGDILLFQRKDGSFILHRCVRIRKGKLTVNGDAQVWTEDISLSQVRAKAVKLYRRGKWRSARPFLGRLWSLTRRIRPLLIRLKNGPLV